MLTLTLIFSWPKVWNEDKDQFANSVHITSSGVVGGGNVWNDTLFSVRMTKWTKSGALLWNLRIKYNYDTWIYGISSYLDTIYAVGFTSDTTLTDYGTIWKISPNGTLLNTKIINFPSSYLRDIHIDSLGNIFIAGYFWDNRYKAIFSKYDRNLNEVWTVIDSSNYHNYGMSIRTYKDGSVYFLKEGWDSAITPNWKWYLSKLNGWTIQINPSTVDNQASKIDITNNGDIISVGHFWTSHYNWWITLYDNSGNYVWGVSYGLNGVSDMAKDVKYKNGYIYTVGWFDDAPYTWRLRWEKRDLGGGLICQFILKWTNYDPRFSQGYGIDVDEGDTVYVAGYYIRTTTQAWYGVFMKFYGCQQVNYKELTINDKFYVKERVFKEYTLAYNFGKYIDVFDISGKFLKRYYNSKICYDLKPGIYILKTSENKTLTVIKTGG